MLTQPSWGVTIRILVALGLMTTNQEQFNADLLEFAKQETKAEETATRTRRTESRTSELRA